MNRKTLLGFCVVLVLAAALSGCCAADPVHPVTSPVYDGPPYGSG